VALFGASLAVFAKGAVTQGSDYSWLASAGQVSLGNSKLNLSLFGDTPRAGDSLTIVTAANGVTGKFSQGSSVTVNGFTFKITYNATSVVLTYTPSLRAPSVSRSLDANAGYVNQLYRELLHREAEPAGLRLWAGLLDTGAPREAVVRGIYDSPEHR